MANSPYDGGAGTVPLDPRLPHDFERVNATPDAFGASVAHGMQEAGQGAVKASQFYGQVVADDATNQLFDRWNKRMYGDPSKMVPQPDGTMMPDTGYMGLKGRAAADARPGLDKAMEDDITEIRKNLTSPEQQLAFDRDSRRYRIQLQQHVGAHAEGQFGVWASEVNKAAGQAAATTISNNAYDDEVFNHAKADLIHAHVKDAQIAGGGDDLINAAVQKGTQEAWKARLETISVHNPALATAMVDKYQKELGHLYEPLAQQLRSRSNQAIGLGAAQEEIAKSRAGINPIPPKGQYTPPAIHGAIIAQESSGNPKAPTSIDDARGIGQILPETFKRYARPGERIDNPADNFAVSRRIVDDLSAKYQNDPARVAVAYFSGDGNVAPPGSPTPWKHDRADGYGKTVSSYVADVEKRLGKTATLPYSTDATTVAPQTTGIANPSLPSVDNAPPIPAPPAPPQAPQAPQPLAPTLEQIKAAAYKAVRDRTDLSEEQKEHALHSINQQMTEEQIIEQANEKAKKEADEKAANGYVTRILNGGSTPGIIQQIANDPALKWETKQHMVEAVRRYSGSDVEEATLAYGPGYWNTYKAVTAVPGDPSRIADVGQLLRRAGPGGDLTLPGVQKLYQVMEQSRKSVNDADVERTKVSLLTYAKEKLSFDQEFLYPGVPPLKDPKGMQLFQGQFMPKFGALYNSWVKDGNDPWQFLTQKNVDSMLEGMRPKSEMAMDKVAAKNAVIPAAQADAVPAPAAPAGFSPQAWETVVSARPVLPDGSQVSRAAWGEAVAMLLANPTEKTIEAFNKSALGKSGLNGKKVLEGIREMNEKGKDQDERWLPSWLGFPYASEE